MTVYLLFLQLGQREGIAICQNTQTSSLEADAKAAL